MTLVILIPVAVLAVGLLMWLIFKGKAMEIGKILFFCGTLVTVFVFATSSFDCSSRTAPAKR